VQVPFTPTFAVANCCEKGTNMARYSASGFLIGLIAGAIILFFIPGLLDASFAFRVLYNQQLNSPKDYYSIKDGSIYNVSSTFPLLLGILFAGITTLIYVLKQKR
jgi:hypothetical protein